MCVERCTGQVASEAGLSVISEFFFFYMQSLFVASVCLQNSTVQVGALFLHNCFLAVKFVIRIQCGVTSTAVFHCRACCNLPCMLRLVQTCNSLEILVIFLVYLILHMLQNLRSSIVKFPGLDCSGTGMPSFCRGIS